MNEKTDQFGNNFMVVFGWMITELNLKGNELLVYSVIYGFSQDGVGEYGGSVEYLQKWTNATKKTVISSLNSLQEKGLISKSAAQVGKYKVCKYKAVPLSGVKNTPEAAATGVKITPEEADTGVKITPTGVKITPNNIDNNNTNNISNINNINNINNKNNNTSTEPGKGAAEPKPTPGKLTHEQEFERIWNCYPAGRKQGRKKAFACYLRARRGGTSYTEVMEGLKAYLRQITYEKTDIQFIKQGGTWFAGEGWKDEYNQTPPSGRKDECSRAPQYKSGNRPAALAYEQRSYSMAELKKLGIDFGEDVYEAGD